MGTGRDQSFPPFSYLRLCPYCDGEGGYDDYERRGITKTYIDRVERVQPGIFDVFKD